MLVGVHLTVDLENQHLFEQAKGIICAIFPVLSNPYHKLSSFMEQKPADLSVRLELYDILQRLPKFYQTQISSWLDQNVHLLFPQDGA